MTYTKPQKTLLKLDDADKKAYDDLYNLMYDFSNYKNEHGNTRLEKWLKDTFEISNEDADTLQRFICNMYDFLCDDQ